MDSFFLSHIPYSVFIVDAGELNIAEVNEIAVSSYGYSKEEFLRMNVMDLFPSDDETFFKESFLDEVKEVEKSHKSSSIFLHQRKKRSIFNCGGKTWICSVRYQGRGSVLVVVRDITAQKETEEKMRNRHEYKVFVGIYSRYWCFG